MSSPSATFAAEAFDELYRAEFGRMVRALGLSSGDHQMAEEIAQETFIRAWVRWRRVGGLECPAGWLYTTAFRLAGREQKRRPAVLERSAPVGHAGVTTDRVALEQALSVLPARQRQAVVARHVLGMSASESGDVLGIGPGAFRALLHRAKSALRASAELSEEASRDGR